MKSTILALCLVAAASVGGVISAAQADTAKPCEDALMELRTAMGAAKLYEADMKAVTGLEAKGVERCSADDDTRADGFFADAMALLAKK